MNTVLIYLLCFLSSSYFAHLASRSKDKGVIILCSAISILIPSLIGGLRTYRVGADSMGYGIRLSTAALRYPNFFDYFADMTTEPGCRFLFYWGTVIFGSYSGAFFVCELITMTCFYIGAYKHRKTIPLAFTMLVFYFILYLRTYNEIRQCLAASIIFMGLDNLENSRYLKFSVYIIIATLFHYSAVLAFPFFILFHAVTTSERYTNGPSFKIILILSTAAFLMFVFPIMRTIIGYLPFAEKYEVYLSPDRIKFGYNLLGKYVSTIYFGELIMFVSFHPSAVTLLKGSHNEHNNNFYEFVAVFYIFYMIGVGFFDRILFYNDFANMLVIAALPKFVKEKHLSSMVTIFVLFTVVFFFYRTFILRPTFAVYPYRSVI